MDVATLVARLIPLLDQPLENSDAILELLDRGRKLADYEVARFVVAKRTEPFVRSLLANADPVVRRSAVRWVELTFARSPAAKLLREATKDRSRFVRKAAFHATSALRIQDVALPDTRGLVAQNRGWNPTGWRFGLYRRGRTQRPAPALTALRTRSDVEHALGVSSEELTKLLRPGVGRGSAYVAFEVPKATGGVRVLHAPRPALKRLQRKLLDDLLAPLDVHPAAHGFVKGRSTVTNAKPHVGASIVVKLDLVDFFPTIHFGRLVGMFQYYGAGKEAARALAAIATVRQLLPDGRVAWPSLLPQGAPTSPTLSNLVCRRMDARLHALAARYAATYTRYADDLTFSFREDPEYGLGRFLWWANQIIGQEGFVENLKKRRVLRRRGQMRVTGLVTNDSLSVPRVARRRFRAILHACERLGITKQATGHDEPKAFLLGFASYVAMVQPQLGAELQAKIRQLRTSGPYR